MRIGLGIDTGGTYTDAVLYDFAAKKVLASAKSLTTRADLAVGIGRALDKLFLHPGNAPDLVSLSTTLATNACVENKMGRAKLVFLGGDVRTIERYGAEYGLPPAHEIHIQESYTDFSGGWSREPDWDFFREALEKTVAGLDGIGVIELYSMQNGAVMEKRARAVLHEITDIPIVCGHELSRELGCLQRGAGTLVNAALFPVIKEFMAAIGHSLRERGIAAPVVMVRSDGSLMNEAFANSRPVETLLSGPAASVVGSMELAGSPDCVVVDMGGTTTDIAVVRNGAPIRAEEGIRVGQWQTFVRGLAVHTLGLGGDSAVHCRDGRVWLEEYRAIPLCILASEYDGVLEQLTEQAEATPRHTRAMHEFYLLVKDIADNPRYTDRERAFCAALRGGPLILSRAAAAAGMDEYSIEVSRLLREGCVQLAGFTPTDAMHIRGDFSRYGKSASALGARLLAANVECSVEELCERVYEEVRRKLYASIVKSLLTHEKCAAPDRYGIEEIIDASYRTARGKSMRGYLSTSFSTNLTLVGIGAPIGVFLGDVAAMLGTRAIVPEYGGVANALGAIVGKVHVRREIEVRPRYNTEGITGYIVAGMEECGEFAERASAVEFARGQVVASAKAEAIQRGARGDIAINCRMHESASMVGEGSLFLGVRVIAEAVGTVGL